jgi:uncharacterized protein
MGAIPWYHDGLPFECTGCGSCCTGEPGYVWVSDDEITTLAKALAMEVAQFEQTFVRGLGKRKSLLERPNGDCVFFDGRSRHCNVYEIRPAQCRTWPFWKSNLQSLETWHEVCQACPGSGRGRVVPFEEVETRVAQIRI